MMLKVRLLSFLVFCILLFSPSLKAQEARDSILTVEIKGLDKTKLSFIQGIIKIREGEALDTAQMEADIQMLIRLPSIAHAYYQVFQSHENYYRVYYYVEENFTLIPTFNVWTRGERLWWWAGVSEYNVLGRNILLDLFYQNNGKHSYGIVFNAPFLFSGKWGASASFKDLTSDEPVYFPDGTAIYEYKNRSLEGLGIYRWDFHNTLQFGGSFFREEYTYISGAEEVLDRPDNIVLNKWLIKLNHEYYKVEQYYQYLDGLVNRFNLQSVLTINSPDPNERPFYIFWNDLIYYKRVRQKGNWASRFRVGLSTNNDSPFSPFVVDNHVNVRGVGDRIDRGSGVMLFNTEYRHTLIENDWGAIQGVGFMDTGAWRQPGGEFEDFTEARNVFVNAGGGFRFILKKVFNATLRIDYGVGLTETNDAHGLVLGLGQYF